MLERSKDALRFLHLTYCGRFILIGLFFLSYTIQAQPALAHQSSIWMAYTTQVNFSSKFNGVVEGQWRRSQLGLHPQQALLRASIAYQLKPHVQLATGVIFLRNSPYGAYPAKSTFPEFRTWEQVQFKGGLKQWDTWLRLRLEQRWMYSPVLTGAHYAPGDAVYTNRIRLMNKWNRPLGGTLGKPASFYVSFFDEFFISFGENVKYNKFDQNRIGLALGHKITRNTTIELGYLLQTIIRMNGAQVEHNHTLNVACFSTLNLQGKTK